MRTPSGHEEVSINTLINSWLIDTMKNKIQRNKRYIQVQTLSDKPVERKQLLFSLCCFDFNCSLSTTPEIML